MKRFIVAMLLTLLVCTSAFAMKNEPEGFREIKWGDKPSQHANLKRETDEIYFDPNENYVVGSFDAYSIKYCFDKQEGFYVASIALKEYTDTEQLVLGCSIWGDTYVRKAEVVNNIPQTSIRWIGQRTVIEIRTAYDNDMSRVILLSIVDNERWQRVAFRNENDKPNS